MTSVTLTLRPETEQKLRAKAAEAGQSLESYLQHLAELDAASTNGIPATRPTFEELTGDIALAVEASGMSEAEVGEFFEEVVSEVRADRAAKRNPPQ
jgi:hypothetical protein